MVNTNQEKDERIAVLVTNLSLLALRLGGEAGSLPPSPMLRLYCLYPKFLNKILINIYSNNTLHNALKTNKNAHKKEHTFSGTSKNQKQNGQKRILCKFDFSK